jgi:hypothetical protein
MKISTLGAELFHVNRRTDMTKLIVAFRNIAKESKKKGNFFTNSIGASGDFFSHNIKDELKNTTQNAFFRHAEHDTNCPPLPLATFKTTVP